MLFFTGIHQPHLARHVCRAMISANALRRRKSDFAVGDWLMDSGAFTAVVRDGGYAHPPAEYAAMIRRWRSCGTLHAAVAQDYMCEPIALGATGLTIPDHQRLTIERFDELASCDTGDVPIMPVIQGFTPDDYRRHVDAYGDRLTPGMWVGVGSVCKRQGDPALVRDVLQAIQIERPDLRLHGFGLKLTSLGSRLVRDRLHSADSMAWSYAARRSGGNANGWREAVRFEDAVNSYGRQMSMSIAWFPTPAELGVSIAINNR